MQKVPYDILFQNDAYLGAKIEDASQHEDFKSGSCIVGTSKSNIIQRVQNLSRYAFLLKGFRIKNNLRFNKNRLPIGFPLFLDAGWAEG